MNDNVHTQHGQGSVDDVQLTDDEWAVLSEAEAEDRAVEDMVLARTDDKEVN